jgi:hypothetical protein
MNLARPGHTLLLLSIPLVSLACTDAGTSGPDPLRADHSSIADPVARWQAYGLVNYSLVQSRDCFCVDGGKKYLVTIRAGKIASVADAAGGGPLGVEKWGDFKTVPDLFALVASIDTSAVASLQVTYDPRYGYPSRVYVDPSAQIADEQYGYETAIVH